MPHWTIHLPVTTLICTKIFKCIGHRISYPHAFAHVILFVWSALWAKSPAQCLASHRILETVKLSSSFLISLSKSYSSFKAQFNCHSFSFSGRACPNLTSLPLVPLTAPPLCPPPPSTSYACIVTLASCLALVLPVSPARLTAPWEQDSAWHLPKPSWIFEPGWV